VTALALRCTRAVLLGGLATLGLFSVAPAVVGWAPTLVTTGSMAPAVRPGDVVVTAPLHAADASTVPVGSIVLAEDPARPGTLLLHRVVGRNRDGTLVTKGDANGAPDGTPMPPGNLRGLARFTVPAVGVPLLKARAGDPVPAGAVVALTVALVAAGPRRRGRHRDRQLTA
jgi:signal peptidase